MGQQLPDLLPVIVFPVTMPEGIKRKSRKRRLEETISDLGGIAELEPADRLFFEAALQTQAEADARAKAKAAKAAKARAQANASGHRLLQRRLRGKQPAPIPALKATKDTANADDSATAESGSEGSSEGSDSSASVSYGSHVPSEATAAAAATLLCPHPSKKNLEEQTAALAALDAHDSGLVDSIRDVAACAAQPDMAPSTGIGIQARVLVVGLLSLSLCQAALLQAPLVHTQGLRPIRQWKPSLFLYIRHAWPPAGRCCPGPHVPHFALRELRKLLQARRGGICFQFQLIRPVQANPLKLPTAVRAWPLPVCWSHPRQGQN